MIPAFKRFFHDLFYSEVRFRLWARGFLMWAATMATQIALTPQAELVAWTMRGWAIRLVISGVAGFAMFLPAGEMNKKPETPEVKP